MARKNHEVTSNTTDSSRKASPVNNNNYYNKPGAKKVSSPIEIQHNKGSQRLSYNRLSPSLDSTGSSPSTSPGLLAGHYAGCKWSETPSPSALPRPPLHWMPPSPSSCTFFKTSDQIDVSHQQLQVLLKVQA